MWEQFSYYGMRTLLVYYMTKQLLFGQEQASFIYGTYTACAYFTPIVGGVIADRWLGKRKAVIIGASIMALGHFMMAFESLFYFALAAIALGNGLFLPSLPSQIGDLYQRDDPRRGLGVQRLLRRHQHRRLPGAAGLRNAGRAVRLALGLRRRGHRHGAGLLIYLAGQRYLPPEQPRQAAANDDVRKGFDRHTILVLLGIGLSVTVFRAAYEQVGNTVALVGRHRRRPGCRARSRFR